MRRGEAFTDEDDDDFAAFTMVVSVSESDCCVAVVLVDEEAMAEFIDSQPDAGCDELLSAPPKHESNHLS